MMKLQGAAKKKPPKVFHSFFSNPLEFLFEILQMYLLKRSTCKCQPKCVSVKKWQSYRLFNM